MKKEKVILGENVIYNTNSDETGVNNNVIVCGSSGCGKTMSIMEPRLLETYESSLIVTVTKRRIVDKYKRMFKLRGYQVRDLNFVYPMKSDVSFDPLAYITDYSDIIFLAKTIIKANPKKDKSIADPYWDEAAVSLLCAEIAYVLTKDKNATFADVLELHDSLSISVSGESIRTSMDYKFNHLPEQASSSFAMSCWRSFAKLPYRTACCVFGTLNTILDTVFTPEIRRLIAKKQTVNFENIASEKTVLFVSTSAVNTSFHCLVNMFYAQMFKKLFEYGENQPSGKLPIPVHILCDDFATGSRVLNFPEYISIFREKQMSVTLLVQSESQLESIYGKNDTTTIINNCDTYLYMGGMDLNTGYSVSKRLNIPLDEVLYMPIGQMVVFRRGQKPIITKRYNILEHDLYKKITKMYEKNIEEKEKKQEKFCSHKITERVE